MKIEHSKYGVFMETNVGGTWLPDYVIHECSVPDCPGNRNRLKLELWDEMLAALDKLTVMYNARGEFITCITPPHRRDRNKSDYSDDCWLAWDRAVELIAKAKELK